MLAVRSNTPGQRFSPLPVVQVPLNSADASALRASPCLTCTEISGSCASALLLFAGLICQLMLAAACAKEILASSNPSGRVTAPCLIASCALPPW